MQPIDQPRGFSRNTQRGVGARDRLRRILPRPKRYLAGCYISEEIAPGKRRGWMQLQSPHPLLLGHISFVRAPLAANAAGPVKQRTSERPPCFRLTARSGSVGALARSSFPEPTSVDPNCRVSQTRCYTQVGQRPIRGYFSLRSSIASCFTCSISFGASHPSYLADANIAPPTASASLHYQPREDARTV